MKKRRKLKRKSATNSGQYSAEREPNIVRTQSTHQNTEAEVHTYVWWRQLEMGAPVGGYVRNDNDSGERENCNTKRNLLRFSFLLEFAHICITHQLGPFQS